MSLKLAAFSSDPFAPLAFGQTRFSFCGMCEQIGLRA